MQSGSWEVTEAGGCAGTKTIEFQVPTDGAEGVFALLTMEERVPAGTDEIWFCRPPDPGSMCDSLFREKDLNMPGAEVKLAMKKTRQRKESMEPAGTEMRGFRVPPNGRWSFLVAAA